MQAKGFTLLDLMITIIVAGLLAAVAIPGYNGVVQRAQTGEAIGDMGRIQLAVEKFRADNNGVLPANLAAIGMAAMTDPWGNGYQYLEMESGVNIGDARKDRNLKPINTDYDLYSMGKDGETRRALTANRSRDDVVRANNGAYFGLARDY